MLEKIFGFIDSKKILYFTIVAVLAIWFLWTNPDVAIMFFVALVFACSLLPIVNKLSTKMNRNLATTIVISGLLIISAICIIPVVIVGADQITSFAKAFPKYVINLNNTISNMSFFKSIGFNGIETDMIANSVATSSSEIMGSAINIAQNIGSAFLYIFTTIIFLFFFLSDNERIKISFLKLFPSEMRERTAQILHNIAVKLGGYVFAQVIVSGSVWITMTVFLLLAKIHYAIVLGIIAGVLSIIPVVGSAFSLIICLVATYECGIKTLILVTVLFTISHFIENHLARPWVYSKFLKLHPILIFLALFLGAKYAGVVGVIFAPPLAMAICILLDELYINKMG